MTMKARTGREVRLTKGFWLGDTQVTQALGTAAMGSNPSNFEGAGAAGGESGLGRCAVSGSDKR